jgi:hypothetical protein
MTTANTNALTVSLESPQVGLVLVLVIVLAQLFKPAADSRLINTDAAAG